MTSKTTSLRSAVRCLIHNYAKSPSSTHKNPILKGKQQIRGLLSCTRGRLPADIKNLSPYSATSSNLIWPSTRSSIIIFQSNRSFHTSVNQLQKKDYYATLGVAKDAPQPDIKKAYYSLAKKYHPDTNKDPNAKEKFVEVQEAYDILSDEEKRAQYDQYGHSFSERPTGAGGFGSSHDFEDFSKFKSSGGGFGDPLDFMSHIFGGSFTTGKGRGYSQGLDIETSINIDFMEAVKGTNRTITIDPVAYCKSCKGYGTKSGKKSDRCPACSGTGMQWMTLSSGFHVQNTCRECRGKGTKVLAGNRCTTCGGAGRVKAKKVVNVEIPPGIDNKMRIQLTGQGDVPRDSDGPPGDLYVVVNVAPSSIFKRSNFDILYNANIPFYTAILGGFIRIPTVDGEVELKVPTGAQPDQQSKLKSRGVPKLNSEERGDQIITFKVNLPKNLTTRQRELMETYRASVEGISYNSKKHK
ncbi:hypothetical protein G9A89_022946 [Geosiphon pyriformis]|nr:hypothetical protein G9A89_022946 [Geosiphon pyriformis]